MAIMAIAGATSVRGNTMVLQATCLLPRTMLSLRSGYNKIMDPGGNRSLVSGPKFGDSF